MLVTQLHPAALSPANPLPLALLPHQVTDASLQDFLSRPVRTRLTPAHDLPLVRPFEVAARLKGVLTASQWLEGASPYRALQEMLAAEPASDVLQLTISTGRIPLQHDGWKPALGAERNGRAALEVSLHGVTDRVSPFETISTNRPLLRWFEQWLEKKSLSAETFFKLGGKVSLLECNQFLLTVKPTVAVTQTYRGTTLVPADAEPKALADKVIGGISRWFMTNQAEDGSLPYKYWPSAGTYSTADNPIRRLMASVVFNRLAKSLGRQDIRVAARRNLAFNMKRFYEVREGEGMIAWDGSVKLGAIAMAGLAISESPFRPEWSSELAELKATTIRMWQSSGAFRTFLYPPDRNDNQNFYPGEALLFWTTLLSQEYDAELLFRTLKSVAYYKDRFRKRPNPAFVPWHTQAVTMLFRMTGDVSLRDYVFEMNDWLLSHQQWGGTLEQDYWGRFYTPDKPEYGPPHASATGVYLEGLVDAMWLAREAGDDTRHAAYAAAIQRGIRSIAQLQFTGKADAFYISRKERVTGAVRTESDNNEIRIDNMQHALAALLKFQDYHTHFDSLPAAATAAGVSR